MHGSNVRTFDEAKTDPEFTTLGGLRDALNDMPEARLTHAAWGQDGENPVPHRRAVVTEGNDFIEFVSDRYDLVQHREAFQPVVDALENMDVPFRGTTIYYEKQGGGIKQGNVTLGILFDQDDRFRVNAAGFDLGLGILAKNSLDKTASMEVMAAGVDGYCTNGQIFGTIFGSVKQQHMGASELAEAKTDAQEFIESLTERRNKFEQAAQDAAQVTIEEDEIRPLVEDGIGVPARQAEPIEEGLRSGALLTDEQRGGPLNVAQVYQATTNHYTHHYDRSNRQVEEVIGDAEDLLTRPQHLVTEVRAEA